MRRAATDPELQAFIARKSKAAVAVLAICALCLVAGSLLAMRFFS